MSARNKKFSFLIFGLLITAAAILLTCSDKILNSETSKSIEFELALKFSSEELESLAEVVTTYKVTIIADQDTITGNLVYSNGAATGVIENVPAGPSRTVIVEGLSADGTVIYRGSATVTVIADQTVDVTINLLPVAKLVRVSPNFVDGSYGTNFISAIKVNNVNGLTGISLALAYNSTIVAIDSVKKGPAIPAGATVTSNINDGLTFEITHSSSIVDSAGNATLANVYFRPLSSSNCFDSTILDLGVLTLDAPAVNLADIFVDDGKAIVKRGQLNVSSDSLKFGLGIPGLNLDFKKIDISDGCGGSVAYNITKNQPWIDLNTAVAGITPGSIFIDVDPTGLQTGTYHGKVFVNAPRSTNSPFEINVSFKIDRGGRFLVLNRDSLNFAASENGPLPASRQISVIETFGFNIPFNLAKKAPWLNISKAAGTTPDSFSVSVNTTAMAPGVYTDTVVVTSTEANNSPKNLVIRLGIDAVPKFLATSVDTLYFSATEEDEIPAPNNFEVFETGGYNISFTATENASWLDLSGISGITPDTISASVNSTTIAPGTYFANIIVSSTAAENSPQTVVVKYELERGPRVLAIDPANVHFVILEDGPLPSSQTFKVFETGGHTISYSAFENINWITLSGVSGVTSDTVTVSITSTNFSPGLYRDSILISSTEADNSPIYVIVSMGVSVGKRTIETDPESIHFEFVQGSDDYPTAMFRVFESSGYSFAYSITENISWLFVQPESGTTEDTVTVFTSPDIAPGIYVDSLMVSAASADNSPIFVVVTLEVIPALKYLAVDTDSLYLQFIQYSDAVPVGNFEVYELHGFSIPFSAIENIDWLSLSGASGTTPGDIEVNVNLGFEPGVYVDSIMISSDEAENSPIYVKVVFEIVYQSPPAVDVDPDTLFFRAQEDGELPVSKFFTVSLNAFPIPFTAVEFIDWLEVTYDTGATGGNVTVNITSTELAIGIYFDSVLISAGESYESAYEYIQYSVVDTISPAPVTDLSIKEDKILSVILNWTASGDDGATGTASETDLRYATDLETLLDWDEADQVDNEPAPQPSGSQEEYEVTGLEPGSTYYFALEIIDNAGNHSGLSNVDSIYIPPNPPAAPVMISPDSGAADIAVNVTFVWHSVAGADTYSLEYDTNMNFSASSTFSNLTDTILNEELLDYETTYYWRVNATNAGGNSAWSNIWNFSTTSAPPTISGVVKNTDGDPIADVWIFAYDSYPDGSLLDSIATDENGTFSFFDINGTVDIHIVKENFYPQTESVNAPNTNVQIFLLATPKLSPTDQWVDLFCDSAYAYGDLIQVNDVIEAYDPNGVLCGQFVVNTEGAFGFMQVYRDDDVSVGIDEGCVTGDAITLKVNGEIAVPDENLIYPSSYQTLEACFNVTGEIPKWIVITNPAGGEDFYQGSDIGVAWTSTGTSGQVEISLIQPDRNTIVLDTTDNDGQESVTIPFGTANENDWRIAVADLDESISDLSEPFTISSIEILVPPTNIFLNGVESDCVFDDQQFTISEKAGLNIPFSISDTISWLSASPSSGTTPAVITVTVVSNSLTTGTYQGDLEISSSDAHNSPVTVSVEIDVTQYLCGDFDNNCRIQVNDISKLVDYLYRGSAGPVYPDALNVDQCDAIDIGDIDHLYSLVQDNELAVCEGADLCTDVLNDQGERDTLGFVVAVSPNAGESTPKLKLDLYLYNDANTVDGLAAGFNWDNSNMHLDSARFAPYVKDSLSLRFLYEKDVIDTTNLSQRFLFAANNTIFSGIPPSGSPRLLASYYFTLSSWNSGDSIVIDMLSFNQGTTYKAVTANGSYQPVWRGPVIINQTSF